jgi:16S rRNA (adenine1518-N6/adenine1519-N6)-dimethyltransferase
VLTQLVVQVEKLLDLGPQAFSPPPKVDSRLIRLTPLASQPSPQLFQQVARLTAMAFQQRRKQLKTSLGSHLSQLELAGIAATARPEELSVADWVRLAKLF